ncbi:two-component system, NarL family, sensor histidine kinase DesK [Streptococcus equinus]|uniref:histidine kinase n=2 Tax=Streptococcus equinus TaxID=1335 RepID=A0A1H0XP27_STREI|nr:two-component system, NarL family, sensor histidine kinase DesK [Streptococcus equinus]
MFKRIKRIHPLFYLPLAFLAFPFLGVFFFGYPIWTLGITLAFLIGYLFLVNYEKNVLTNIVWIFMLLYIIYMTLCVDGGMMWFTFYFNSLLVFRFQDDYRSFRFVSYNLAMLLMMVVGMTLAEDIMTRVMILLVPLVNYAVLFHWINARKTEAQERALMEKNRTINLLLAENERNRIGRDLHDTLGHVFAAMTLKTELALKQLEKGKYDLVKKELEELNQSSRSSMHDVRNIINNLKFRTLEEEIDQLEHFFAMTDIDYHLQNELNLSVMPPVMQSTLCMILRELSNNVIKHSQANQCQLHLFEKEGKVVVEIKDNGVGFEKLSGDELQSIRDRLLLVKGNVQILSPRKPTLIQAELGLKEN